MFYVYVIQSIEDTDRFYLGYSADLKRRVASHNSGENRSTRYTRWRLVYYEAYLTETSARRRESKLKRNSNMRHYLMARIKEGL